MSTAKATKSLNKNPLILYHGNKDKNMLPEYNKGKADNDYGRGFYTTTDLQLAKEWAWSGYSNGDKAYVHCYELDIRGLNILDFTKLDSVHWVAELLQNRTFGNLIEVSEIGKENAELLKKKYKLDTDNYDIIIGYRADDSYFSYAVDFVTGQIYRETLDKALHCGSLGLQVFIKSKRAFDRLNFISVEEVPKKFETDFKNRDVRARNEYKDIKRSNKSIKRTSITDYIK